MSQRAFRGTAVPVAAGLAAIIAVSGAPPALAAAAGAPAATAVQAREWWLSSLSVRPTWRLTEGAGVTVAVLSTGVAAGQRDLTGSVVTGPDFTGSGRTAGRPYWGMTGTATASIIAGHGYGPGGEAGLLGVAPAARILSIRVSLEADDPLHSDPAVTGRLPSAIADGIIYAVNHGARIIDLPLDPAAAGEPGMAPAAGLATERAAVNYAVAKGAELVAPAGDDGEIPGPVNYPAAYPGVLAVGAVARDGQLASFSARHRYVALTAPGVDLVAAAPGGGYPQVSSTSSASAIVAGVAALIWSRFPQLTAAQVSQALAGSATVTTAATVGGDQAGTGHGTVDAARALDLAAGISSASSPAAGPPQAPGRNHDASAMAGSLVRYVVAGAAGLIVLLLVLLLVMRSRRKRPAEPSRARPRGQHEQRRPERRPSPGPLVVSPGRPAGAAPAPALASGPGSPARGATGTGPLRAIPAGAASWQAAGGWQGTSVGEIATPRPAPERPAIAPAPKPPRPATGSGGPPWAPAPEPGRQIGPLPVAANSAMPLNRGPALRVPGDMTSLAGSNPDAPAPAAPGPDLADPDFPPRPVTAGGDPGRAAHAPGPNRASLGFAAAPVPADFGPPEPEGVTASRLAPDFTVPSPAAGLLLSGDGGAADNAPRSAPGPAAARRPRANPGYIWDLAGHDVFPAADPVGGGPLEGRQSRDPD